jgi:hypothetical protein
MACSLPGGCVHKHHYTWVLALSMVDTYQASTAETDIDDQGVPMAKVTARAGHIQASTETAANDALVAAALSILLLVYVWNCANYRANLRVIDKNGIILCQTQESAFLTRQFAETLAIQWLRETGRLFLESDTLCQMNSPLTLSICWAK